MKRVGIPQALLFHRYGEFWKEYWRTLGYDVVLSAPTNQAQLERGSRLISAEVCLPIKALAGHLEELTHKTDFIFLPQYITDRHGLYACPKMIGISDLARLLFPETSIYAPKIKGDFLDRHFWLGLARTHNPWRARRALTAGRAALRPTRGLPLFPSDRTKVALLCHFYVFADNYLTGDIRRVLEDNNTVNYSKEDLLPSILEKETADNRPIRWVYERELYNAFDYFLGRVDGICSIVSFGCGPDSLVSELFLRRAQEAGVPFLPLVIDEHTGRAGLVTRLEAFIDIVRRRAPHP